MGCGASLSDSDFPGAQKRISGFSNDTPELNSLSHASSASKATRTRVSDNLTLRYAVISQRGYYPDGNATITCFYTIFLIAVDTQHRISQIKTRSRSSQISMTTKISFTVVYLTAMERMETHVPYSHGKNVRSVCGDFKRKEC